MKRWWPSIAFVIVVATQAVADDLSVGARLRVTRANGNAITGQLAAFDERTLTLNPVFGRSGDSEHVVVSREDIQRIDISRVPSRKLRGAGIGFLSGAAIGAFLGYRAGDASCQNGPCFYRQGAAELFGVLLGGLGAGIGALASPGEKWETLDLAHVAISVRPVRRGTGIVVAVRF